MRLTMYTDYTLRALIFLTLAYRRGEKATIPEIAEAYGISRNHLMKIIHDLSQRGLIETSRGRAGGAMLARDPTTISVGDIVRGAEPDFELVECHSAGGGSNCAVFHACNLERGFRVALQAFLAELDKMSLADAVDFGAIEGGLNGIGGNGRRVIPIAAAPAKVVSADPSQSMKAKTRSTVGTARGVRSPKTEAPARRTRRAA